MESELNQINQIKGDNHKKSINLNNKCGRISDKIRKREEKLLDMTTHS